jgi:hypothetical protein
MLPSLKLPVLLVLFGCGVDLGPTGSISGTWAAPNEIPGSSFILVLTQDGTSVTGTGSWSGEACCQGTMQVAGSFSRGIYGTRVDLSLHYDDGRVRSYDGSVRDASHINGSLDGMSLPLVRH